MKRSITLITKIITLLVAFAMLIGLASAATLTCQQITETSLSISQFSSTEVEIQCTASGGAVAQIQLVANSDPSQGLTISPTQTISSTLSSGSSGTAKWNIEGDTPNSYDLSYTVFSDGTNAWSGTSETSLEVKSPAKLTVEYVLPPSIFTPTVETLDFKISNIGGNTASNIKVQLNDGTKYTYPTTIGADSSSSYSWTNSTGFNESGTYTTKVYIGDVLHDSATIAVTHASESINQTNGWNLFSVPRSPSNTSVAAVLDSIDGQYDDVFAWNGSGQNWMSYNALFPAFATLDEINETMGVWVRITDSEAQLNVTGDSVTSVSMTLYPGWNLIGYPLTAKNVSVALSSIDGQYDDVWTFDGSTPLNYNALFPAFADFEQLESTKGYWVRVTAGTPITLTMSE